MSQFGLEEIQTARGVDQALLKKHEKQVESLQNMFGWSLEASFRELEQFKFNADAVAQHHFECTTFVVLFSTIRGFWDLTRLCLLFVSCSAGACS
jgi:hypothetical protein